MNRLEAAINRLHQTDPDIANILDIYREIEEVYGQIQEALGVTNNKINVEVRNSADVSLVIGPESPISTTQWKEKSS